MTHLDTHVALRLFSGNLRDLSKEARRLLNRDEVAVSPIVRIEMDLLFEIRRIERPGREVLRFLDEQVGVRLAASSFREVAEVASHLAWTRDPFDRVIVAQAELEMARLITLDSKILARFPRALC